MAEIWDLNRLPSLAEPAEADFQRAHRRLMGSLRESRADCAWVEGPFGPVFVARTRRGVCRVSFRRSEDELLAALERDHLLPEMAPHRLDRERRQLEAYFDGGRRDFRLPLDLGGLTPFQLQVLDAAREIPYGEVTTYGAIASRIHRPAASRAVGNALGQNPIAIVIPGHRVVAAGGGLGGYTGGLDIKRMLMAIEGIRVEEERR